MPALCSTTITPPNVWVASCLELNWQGGTSNYTLCSSRVLPSKLHAWLETSARIPVRRPSDQALFSESLRNTKTAESLEAHQAAPQEIEKANTFKWGETCERHVESVNVCTSATRVRPVVCHRNDLKTLEKSRRTPPRRRDTDLRKRRRRRGRRPRRRTSRCKGRRRSRARAAPRCSRGPAQSLRRASPRRTALGRQRRTTSQLLMGAFCERLPSKAVRVPARSQPSSLSVPNSKTSGNRRPEIRRVGARENPLAHGR